MRLHIVERDPRPRFFDAAEDLFDVPPIVALGLVHELRSLGGARFQEAALLGLVEHLGELCEGGKPHQRVLVEVVPERADLAGRERGGVGRPGAVFLLRFDVHGDYFARK